MSGLSMGGAFISSWPLDVLRACLGFWPLRQRVEAECLSRRWQEAAADAALWSDLDLAEAVDALPTVLGRGRAARLRRLVLTVNLQGMGLQALLASVATCSQLTRLSLRGLRGLDLMKRDHAVRLPVLRTLELEYLPYFVLRWYSHSTGLRAATVSAAWVAECCPSLEELVCDYLQVAEPAKGEAADARGTRGETEGDARLLGLRPHARRAAAGGPPGERADRSDPAAGVLRPELTKLRCLSFVAVVRVEAEAGVWNDASCCCDLSAVAGFAPGLQRLELRCPRMHLGRVSRRPGQSVDDLAAMCRRFCATSLSSLRHVCGLLPELRELHITALKEGTSEVLKASGDCLATFLGLQLAGTRLPSEPAAWSALGTVADVPPSPLPPPEEKLLAAVAGTGVAPSCAAAWVAPRRLRITVGSATPSRCVGGVGTATVCGSTAAAAPLVDAAARCDGSVVVELLEPQ